MQCACKIFCIFFIVTIYSFLFFVFIFEWLFGSRTTHTLTHKYLWTCGFNDIKKHQLLWLCRFYQTCIRLAFSVFLFYVCWIVHYPTTLHLRCSVTLHLNAFKCSYSIFLLQFNCFRGFNFLNQIKKDKLNFFALKLLSRSQKADILNHLSMLQSFRMATMNENSSYCYFFTSKIFKRTHCACAWPLMTTNKHYKSI